MLIFFYIRNFFSVTYLSPLRRAIGETLLSFVFHLSRAATLSSRSSSFAMTYEAFRLLSSYWKDVEKAVGLFLFNNFF
jgi:hypothetical protein